MTIEIIILAFVFLLFIATVSDVFLRVLADRKAPKRGLFMDFQKKSGGCVVISQKGESGAYTYTIERETAYFLLVRDDAGFSKIIAKDTVEAARDPHWYDHISNGKEA